MKQTGANSMALVLSRFFLAICIVTLLNACGARKSVIVLLPDQYGKTGAIEIRNQGGSQKLDAPNQATEILSSETAPDPPKVLPENELKTMFAEAMEAMPSAPAHHTLYFFNNSTKFTEESTRIFEDVLASIKRVKPAEITIVGHTDRVGKRKKNFRLGFHRATYVKHLLLERGVDPGIVEITSHGEDDPLIKTKDEIAESRNRRVEMVIR